MKKRPLAERLAALEAARHAQRRSAMPRAPIFWYERTADGVALVDGQPISAAECAERCAAAVAGGHGRRVSVIVIERTARWADLQEKARE